MKTILIGDIHGCFNALTRLLRKVNFKEEEDTIIFVGDYTDRGLMSYDVVTYLRQLKEKMKERCVLIRGNHEQMAMEYVRTKDTLWFLNGGKETIRDFRDCNGSLEDYAKFLEENTEFYYQTKLFDVCHAGAETGVTVDNEEDLMWNRYPFRYGLCNNRLVIVGHTPIKKPALSLNMNFTAYPYHRKLEIPKAGTLCIDTGCVFGGVLTALVMYDDYMQFEKVSM